MLTISCGELIFRDTREKVDRGTYLIVSTFNNFNSDYNRVQYNPRTYLGCCESIKRIFHFVTREKTNTFELQNDRFILIIEHDACAINSGCNIV